MHERIEKLVTKFLVKNPQRKWQVGSTKFSVKNAERKWQVGDLTVHMRLY
jgi:hypothetical protein